MSLKHAKRCETCLNGFLHTKPTSDKKSTYTVYVCSKSPYKAPFLDDLWAYIDLKGCEQWIDKLAKPVIVKPVTATVKQRPVFHEEPEELPEEPDPVEYTQLDQLYATDKKIAQIIVTAKGTVVIHEGEENRG